MKDKNSRPGAAGMDFLSRGEMKHITGGKPIVICGGEGNYVERCACGSGGGPFYCCHNSVSTCVSETCGSSSGYVCSKNTTLTS